MSESHEDMLSRIEAMSTDNGETWDLSPKDREALAWAVGRIATLEKASLPFVIANVEDELDGLEDAFEVPMTYPAGALRAVAKAMEER